MNSSVTEAKTYVGDEACNIRVCTRESLGRQIGELMKVLYPDEDNMLSASEVMSLLRSEREVFVFRFEGRVLVAMAQGTLNPVTKHHAQVVIGNVITRPDEEGGKTYRKQGHARAVLSVLRRAARMKWESSRSVPGFRYPKVGFVLTNNPEKGNAGVYERTGWTPVPTQVWAFLGSD